MTIGRFIDMVQQELDSYQGDVRDDIPAEELDEEGDVLDLVEFATSLVIRPDGAVIVDDGFEFALDHSMMSFLVWTPSKEDHRLVGIFQGQVTFAWTEDEEDNPSIYYIVRVGNTDRLVPAWNAVTKRFNEFSIGDRVLILYRGLKHLKNGRTWHDFLIGRKTFEDIPVFKPNGLT